eukprot:307355-Pleurochrysis_carterae.AAC.1
MKCAALRAVLDALQLDGVLKVKDEEATMLAATGVSVGPALRGSFLAQVLERMATLDDGAGAGGARAAGADEGGGAGSASPAAGSSQGTAQAPRGPPLTPLSRLIAQLQAEREQGERSKL